jgi:PAS domain S-box-containing protein
MTPEQFLELGELLPDPLFMVADNGRIEAANHAALQALGLEAEQVFGRPLTDFAAYDTTRLMAYLRLCSGSRQPLAGQLTLRDRNKGETVFRCDGAVLRPAAEGLQALICLRCIPRQISNSQFVLLNQKVEELNREIVARRRSEEQVLHLNEELEQRIAERTNELQKAYRDMESFSYSVSHDLRSPLRSIHGFGQALLEDYGDRLDDTGRDYLRRVCTGALKLERLIDDLLEFSRVGRRAIRREEVSLSGLSGEIIEQLRSDQPGRRAGITIGEQIHAFCDAHLLRIALDNLLKNAWKYSGKVDCAHIEFGRLEQDHEQVYYVRDNGAGFDMRYADKLFKAFQRLHSANDFAGTGIGLATVQRIIERHGGRIWADSEPGKGATFYFTLVPAV